MKLLFLCAALLLSLAANAGTTNDCQELRNWQLRLALTASNLQNVNTTRTPEGGPYQPFEIRSCGRVGCDVVKKTNPLLRYLPNHPDANAEGYVAYPNIDSKAELLTFTVTAKKLMQLAAKHICGASISESGHTSYLEYRADADRPREDQFAFDTGGNIASWAHVDHLGHLSTVGFNTDGDIVSRK